MAIGSPSLGLGEYLTLYAIIAVAVIAALGYVLGTGLGGALVFFIGVALAVLLIYAIASRLYRFLLHGSISAGSDSGRDGGDI